jgi:putative ABC transport system ATP-binding protein
MPAVQLSDLRKYYGKGEQTVRALDGIDLTVDAGEFIAVVGRSGSGKTTLLDAIGLLMRPTTGRIMLDGVDTTGLKDSRRAEFRGRKIGFIFQDFNLLDTLTARENVLLPVRYTGVDRKAAEKRADELLAAVELSERAHHRPTQMSGGEKQRICIARALINEPGIVLGDEPTGNLDTDTSQNLMAVMKHMNHERGVTFVIVTHDLELASRTNRIVRLRDGRIVADEPVAAPDGAVAAVALPAPVAAG